MIQQFAPGYLLVAMTTQLIMALEVNRPSDVTHATKRQERLFDAVSARESLPPSSVEGAPGVRADYIVCPDSAWSCPDYNTCCLMPNYQWVCCPLPMVGYAYCQRIIHGLLYYTFLYSPILML